MESLHLWRLKTKEGAGGKAAKYRNAYVTLVLDKAVKNNYNVIIKLRR